MRLEFWIPFAYCIGMRFVELAVSRRNEARAVAVGGHRVRPDATGPLVFVHTLWFVGMLAEELLVGPRPWPRDWLLFAGAIAVAAEMLRVWCMLSLGERWNVAVVIRPGAPLVRRGPYRFLPHPNYLAVIGLLVALPLALGLPWTAAGIVPLKAWALSKRLRIENQALRLGLEGS